MMVKFFNTVVAHFAVFWPSWFINFTCFALIIFAIHNFVKFILFDEFFSLLGCSNDTWIVCAGPIEAIITYKHQSRPRICMPRIKKWSRQIVHHALLHIYYKTASSYEKVEPLYDRILLVYNICYIIAAEIIYSNTKYGFHSSRTWFDSHKTNVKNTFRKWSWLRFDHFLLLLFAVVLIIVWSFYPFIINFGALKYFFIWYVFILGSSLTCKIQICTSGQNESRLKYWFEILAEFWLFVNIWVYEWI